ncbi:von Willebrand factor type A domain-containing protein [Streptomyces sp. NPDC020802]|uniref:VWA domain-containing protein n=1 Tax=Streptomyces sp. NPDC020802 TaxID=3365094 RepID=UPI0037BB965F
MRRTERHQEQRPHTRGRRRRARGALVAVSVTAGLLLTACSGGNSDSSRDHGGTEAREKDGFPAPAPALPTAGGDEGSAEGEKGELRESAPPADYLSTFALDVDTASYGYARRTLEDGRRPAPSTIRPEEFINSLRQNYERPEGNGFTVTMDGARPNTTRDPVYDPNNPKPREDTDDPYEGNAYEGNAYEGNAYEDDPYKDNPYNDDPYNNNDAYDTFGENSQDWRLVRVGLATREPQDSGERPPAALTFVIDVSGSMAEPGRLDLVKDSLGVMTDRLRDDDAVALVTFSDEAETILPMTRLGDRRDRVHDAIDTLEPTLSTNLGAGVSTGYRTAVDGLREGATNRVVLLSDALANDGETDADAILDRIADARRKHGITLFGVGVGSDYGDALMERLADKGDGHTTYVSSTEEARTVFCDELPRNIDLTARDAKAQVAFDPRTVEQFRLIGYDNRQVADEDFRDDRVDGGEVGPGHTVTALYAVRTKPGATGHVATATVRWLDPRTRVPYEETGQVEAESLDRPLWSTGTARSGLQATVVAAYFADVLRSVDGRPNALPGTPPLRDLARRADRLATTTDSRTTRQLAESINQATTITN